MYSTIVQFAHQFAHFILPFHIHSHGWKNRCGLIVFATHIVTQTQLTYFRNFIFVCECDTFHWLSAVRQSALRFGLVDKESDMLPRYNSEWISHFRQYGKL